MNNKIYIALGLALVVIGGILIIISTIDFSYKVELSQKVENRDTVLVESKKVDTVQITTQNVDVVIDSIQVEEPKMDSIDLPKKVIAKDQKKYLIVLGTFKILSNANKLVDELKQKSFINSYVYSKGELNYVILNSYNSRSEANSDLTDSKLDGWVKKI